MTECAFCVIAAGERQARGVHSDDDVVAFLDHRPLFPGHVLVTPRDHIPTLSDLPTERIETLFGTVQRLERAVRAAVDAEGTFVALNNIVSQSVPHLHVHVVPRRRGDGLRGFFWPRHGYEDEAHADSVQRAVIRALRG